MVCAKPRKSSSKAWLESRFTQRAEFSSATRHAFGMAAGPADRLSTDAKAHVALSKCLRGDAVRHNAGHCYTDWIVTGLGEHLSFEGVCPEVDGLGLGVPRETIRLVNTSADIEDWGSARLLGSQSGTDFTAAMASYAGSRLEALDRAGINGYILKAQSPSCGLRGIPVYPSPNSMGRGTGKPQAGMFAKALMELWPELPIEDEGRLTDVTLRSSFLTRVEAHKRWRRAQHRRTSSTATPFEPLVEFHAEHALLLAAHDAAAARELGELVDEAGTDGGEDELYHRFYKRFFGALKSCPSRKSTATCLHHCLAVLQGRSDGDAPVQIEADEEEADDDAPLLGLMLLGPADDFDDEEILSPVVEKEEPGAKEAPSVGVVRSVSADLTRQKSVDGVPSRPSVIDDADAEELSEAIEDYVAGMAPLSVPLGLFARQKRQLSRAWTDASEIGCAPSEQGQAALQWLSGQVFLRPHGCRRLLATIRQTKTGDVDEPSAIAYCV